MILDALCALSYLMPMITLWAKHHHLEFGHKETEAQRGGPTRLTSHEYRAAEENPVWQTLSNPCAWPWKLPTQRPGPQCVKGSRAWHVPTLPPAVPCPSHCFSLTCSFLECFFLLNISEMHPEPLCTHNCSIWENKNYNLSITIHWGIKDLAGVTEKNHVMFWLLGVAYTCGKETRI